MSRISRLLANYQRYVSLKWDQNLAGPQRVWFAVYRPSDERRLRLRIDEFETVTRAAGHGWDRCDLTDAFARWMSGQEYREAYFEQPEDLAMALGEFIEATGEEVRKVLQAASDNDVVAITGVASLFGLMRVSQLVKEVEDDVRGRLLVFFPGEYEDNNYRLLDARDGWNYLAVPITDQQELASP